MQALFTVRQWHSGSIDFSKEAYILLAGKDVVFCMYRLFVGLDLPWEVKEQLARISCGLPGARWLEPEQIHLNLRFIGEVDGGVFDDAIAALETTSMEPFDLTLKGVGFYPPRGKTETLWVGVDKSEPLAMLRTKVEAALARAGIEREQRKYSPHVVIARLKDSQANRLGQYIVEYNLFESMPFRVDEFHLYSSMLSSSGAIYRIESSYQLVSGSKRHEEPS